MSLIPANQLIETMYTIYDFIEAEENLLKKTPGQSWEELDQIAEEKGTANFLQHIEKTYSYDAKKMLSDIFSVADSINSVTFSSVYLTVNDPNLGILVKRVPESLAKDSVQAFEKVSMILRNYYMDDAEFNLAAANVENELVRSKESLEAELLRDEAEILQKLKAKSNGKEFFMITVFCDNPAEFNPSEIQQDKIIDEMRRLQQTQTRMDISTPDTHNRPNGPSFKP